MDGKWRNTSLGEGEICENERAEFLTGQLAASACQGASAHARKLALCYFRLFLEQKWWDLDVA